ncbi:MAG: sulfotransferase [Actinomycetota bacterium]
MARIVVGSYMVRYPLGGMLSWVLQYLVGFDRLGHEVWFVEKAGGPDACFDPDAGVMTNDASYGVRHVGALLDRFGLGHRWCFVDHHGAYHGLGRADAERVLQTADVFIDMGTHGAWLDEVGDATQRVFLDGEPGFTQIRWHHRLLAGESLPHYDRWFTTGANVGRGGCAVPTLGVRWEHIWHPVVTDLFDTGPPPPGGPFTSVMNWRSHTPVELDGVVYGHKDVELERFAALPTRVGAPLELAVAGAAPRAHLEALGWKVRHGHDVSRSFDDFTRYVASSAGEFGVCKNAFVALRTGWFSDRSAAYLASGRPVVLQDTGFGEHLPTGNGLFAVTNLDEAAAALDEVASEPVRHGRAARTVALEHLDSTHVLSALLTSLGVSRASRSSPTRTGEGRVDPYQTPFLVVGAGRSGTSLLATSLGAHPDIEVGFERWAMEILLGTAPRWRAASASDRIAGFLAKCRHAGSDSSTLLWGNKVTSEQLAGVAEDRTALDDLVQGPLSAVPIVAIVRDGRACISSKVRRGGVDLKEACERWLFAMTLLDAIEASPAPVHVVRYEDLVTAPAETLGAVCRFLGVDFDPVMLEATMSDDMPADYRRAGFDATAVNGSVLPEDWELLIGDELRARGYA